MPPDHTANPSATSGGRHPLGPGPVLGPAAGAGQAALPHTAAAQRLEQAAPPLAVRPGERALRPRRRAEPPRVGAVGMDALAPPGALPAQRAPRAVGARRRAHGRAQVEHGLVELPRRRRPARAGPRAPSPGAPRAAAPATPRARTRTPLVSTAATSSPKAKDAHRPRRVGPDAGQRAQRGVLGGTTPSWSADDGRRGPVQVQRPPVVAEPRPQPDHVGRSGRRAGRRRRERRRRSARSAGRRGRPGSAAA